MKHCPCESFLSLICCPPLSQSFQCDMSSSYVGLQVEGGMWFSRRGEATFKGSAYSSTFSFYSNHGECATKDCQRWLSPALSLYSSFSQASVKLCSIFEHTFKIHFFSDETFTSFHPEAHLPLSLIQGRPVYMEVSILEPPEPGLVLLVYSCFAYTQSTYSNWMLVYDGCVQNNIALNMNRMTNAYVYS